MYKTLITDLDGTLLGEDHDISKETIELLNKLNKKGINIILATGRNYNDAIRVRDKLSFIPPIITANGAELTDENDKLIFKVLMDKDIVDEILSIDYKAISKEIYLNFVENDSWVGVEEYPKGHKLLEWVTEEWPFIVKKEEELNYNNMLKVFFSGEHEELLILLEKIKEKVGDRVNYAFTLPFALEIFPKGINKANALKKLSEIKNIDFNNAVSFGDGFNDLEMLNLTKKAYLMGNAPEELKKSLKNIKVIKKNSENGLQEKVKEIFGVE